MKTKLPSTPVSDNPLLRFDFGYLYHLLLSKWWLVILVVVLIVSAAIAYLIVTPKLYESRAVVQVAQEAQKVVNIQDINQDDYKDTRRAEVGRTKLAQ